MKKKLTAALFTFSAILCYQSLSAQKVVVHELIEAVWKNDAARVERLIKQGANVNAKHEDTVLVEAIDKPKANIKIIKLLLDAKGINVNLYSTRPMGTFAWSRTPLIAAVYTGNVEAVRLLLARGAQVNATDNHVPTHDIVGPTPLNTALMYAAAAGSVELTTMLLDKGANIEQMNSTGLTPLMFAVGTIKDSFKAKQKENAVKTGTLLLDRGAKVDSNGFSSTTRFMNIDLPKGTPASVNRKGISRGGGGVTALMYASQNGFIEGAKLLLDRGAKIELEIYGNKWTSLLIAANANKTDMVNYLLDRGAKIEAVDPVGNNALLLASTGLFHDTVLALLKRKANVNAFVHTSGANALMNAINFPRTDQEKNSIRMMKILIDNGIDVNFQGVTGNTALMYASGWGVVTKKPERAKILLDAGAKVNLQNKKGETALMMAAYRGYVDTAKLLIARGADLELKNAEGQTALMIASTATIDMKSNNKDFPAMVKFFLDKGAQVNAKDKNNRTALSLAQKNGHTKIIAILKSKGANTDPGEKQDDSGKAIVGIWEGLQNSNPYDLHRYTFKSGGTWTYEIKATPEMMKLFPKGSEQTILDSLKTRAKQQGDKGTYSFRGQFLVLKTNSAFSPQRVFGWSVEKDKLNLNGTEFILKKVYK